MNFLWIEDSEKISNLKKGFFDDAKDFDEKLHNLIIPKSFDEALIEINNANQKYDFIILDINLEEFSFEENNIIYDNYKNILSKDEFMKEAGFHLYLKLIPLGFEKDRIIFLTGNTKENHISALLWRFEQAFDNNDEEEINTILEKMRKAINTEEYGKIVDLINEQHFNDVRIFWKKLADEYEIIQNENQTYDIFKNRFMQARIPLPFSIHKNNKNDFHIWLKGRTRSNDLNSYILLRRAIIDSYSELMEEAKDANEIIFNKTLFKDKNGEVINPLTLKDIEHYFEKLKYFFPLNPPSEDQKKEKYYSFVKELSDLWERSQGFIRRSDVNYSSIEYNFKNFCQNQMKLLRNWTAHNQLSNDLSEKELAFYFMIAMRALFNLEVDKICRYEELIFSMFEKYELNNKEILKNLADSYYSLRDIYAKNQNPSRSEFNNVLEEVWKQKVFKKEDSIKFFYQNFFHSLNPAILKLYEVSKAEKYKNLQDKVVMFVDFRFLDLEKLPFLKELAKLVYSEAFVNLE